MSLPQMPVRATETEIDTVKTYARLLRQWKGLWAQHGDDPQGHDAFRAAFDAFAQTVRPLAQGVTLRNDMPWLQVVMVMLSRTAVAPAGLRAIKPPGEYP